MRKSAPVFRSRRRRGLLFYILTTLVFILLIGIAAVFGGGYWYMSQSVPQQSGTLELSALRGEVRVYRDERGIPHIEASNVHDLFFAQGFVTAQDRLWQMDMFRRVAGGRMAEVLGESELEQDKFFRILNFRGAAAKSKEVIGPEAFEMGEAYAAGVSTYIEHVTSGQATLPIEFRLLGYTPEPWTMDDSLLVGRLMAYQLSGNWDAEVERYRIAELFGWDVMNEWLPDYPDVAPTIVTDYNPLARIPAQPPAPTASDGSDVDLDHTDDSSRTPDPNTTTPIEIDNSLRARGGIIASLEPFLPFAPVSGLGSNSWALAPQKTETGGALLANDPHMQYGIPALWHQVQLVLEGDFSATGIGVPGVPGVVFGRNEHIAWAITSLAADSQDLYIQRTNPDNPRQFLYKGQWENADVRTEVIHVKGSSVPVTLEVLDTRRHGPILTPALPDDTADAISIAWTALGATREINALLPLMRARDFDEFESALDDFDMPSLSFLYADVEGNIGYKAVGLLPRRPRREHAGRIPQPAWEGEYDWLGTIPKNELPRSYNPESGFIVTANNLPADDVYPHYIGDGHHPWRALRITELLEARSDFSVADMRRMQMDAFNTHARRMNPLLTEAAETRFKAAGNMTAAEEAALHLLETWDYVEHAEAGAPYIWHMWQQELKRLVIEERLGFEAKDGLLLDHLLLAMRRTELEDVAYRSFREAVRVASLNQGKDPARWEWGRFHRMTAVHPVSAGLPGTGWLLNVGDWPLAGSDVTPGMMGFDVGTGQIQHGASWRAVIDLHSGRGEDVLLPGNSGHILSPAYKDQAETWRAGGLFEQQASPTQYRRGELLRLLPR